MSRAPKGTSYKNTRYLRDQARRSAQAQLEPILVARGKYQEVKEFNESEWPEAWAAYWSEDGEAREILGDKDFMTWEEGFEIESRFTVQMVNTEAERIDDENDLRCKKTGAIYILHFDRPYKHARHYVGFTPGDPQRRLEKHISGEGSPLIKAALAAGISVQLAEIRYGQTRDDERKIKRGKNTPRICRICKQERKKNVKK